MILYDNTQYRINITTSDFFSWNTTNARVWFVKSFTSECIDKEKEHTHGGGVYDGVLYDVIFLEVGVYEMCLFNGQSWTRYDAVQVNVTQAPSPPPPPLGGAIQQSPPPPLPPPASENVTLIYVEPYESLINYDRSNTMCCQAIIASCEACKRGTTVVDYCKAYPNTTGCNAVRHKVYTAKSDFAGQGRCANEGSLIAKLDGDLTFARKTLVFYHSVFKSGNFPNDFQFQKNYQYVKFDKDACANFEVNMYTRLFDTTTNNAHRECLSNSESEFLQLDSAAECLLACDRADDCEAFTFYPHASSLKCKIHTTSTSDTTNVHLNLNSETSGICYARNPPVTF